jgi:uncharacterized YigZ family protein
MTAQSYPIPAQICETVLEVKRSKFLSFAGKAENRAQAETFIRNLKEQHPQANHVCWAYIAGAPNTTIRSMSDDGEPSGTAGMPMLKVLEYSGFGEIVVAIVRYFGGTKLGTGGLQRAYSDAVSLVLADLSTQQKVPRTTIKLVYDYPYESSIAQLLKKYDTADIDFSYEQLITVDLAIASSELGQFKSQLVNLTSGGVEVQLPIDQDLIE